MKFDDVKVGDVYCSKHSRFVITHKNAMSVYRVWLDGSGASIGNYEWDTFKELYKLVSRNKTVKVTVK